MGLDILLDTLLDQIHVLILNARNNLPPGDLTRNIGDLRTIDLSGVLAFTCVMTCSISLVSVRCERSEWLTLFLAVATLLRGAIGAVGGTVTLLATSMALSGELLDGGIGIRAVSDKVALLVAVAAAHDAGLRAICLVVA